MAITVNQTTFDKMLKGSTHFCKDANSGMAQIFSIDKCDKCGCEIEAANTIKVARGSWVMTRAHLASKGLIEKPLPGEGYLHEATGDILCYGCYSEADDNL